jgi:hypothetical protein
VELNVSNVQSEQRMVPKWEELRLEHYCSKLEGEFALFLKGALNLKSPEKTEENKNLTLICFPCFNWFDCIVFGPQIAVLDWVIIES